MALKTNGNPSPWSPVPPYRPVCCRRSPLAFLWPCWTNPDTAIVQLANAAPPTRRSAPKRRQIMQERWLSVEEIAARLGVNQDAI